MRRRHLCLLMRFGHQFLWVFWWVSISFELADIFGVFWWGYRGNNNKQRLVMLFDGDSGDDFTEKTLSLIPFSHFSLFSLWFSPTLSHISSLDLSSSLHTVFSSLKFLSLIYPSQFTLVSFTIFPQKSLFFYPLLIFDWVCLYRKFSPLCMNLCI